MNDLDLIKFFLKIVSNLIFEVETLFNLLFLILGLTDGRSYSGDESANGFIGNVPTNLLL